MYRHFVRTAEMWLGIDLAELDMRNGCFRWTAMYAARKPYDRERR
jgi:hypothetical protein